MIYEDDKLFIKRFIENLYNSIPGNIRKLESINPYSIKWFDHEELFNVDFEKGITRKQLESLEKSLYNNFREFMEDFWKIKI